MKNISSNKPSPLSGKSFELRLKKRSSSYIQSEHSQAAQEPAAGLEERLRIPKISRSSAKLDLHSDGQIVPVYHNEISDSHS